MALKDLIKQVRENAKISQREMAEKLNTTAMTVSRWERGVNEPGSETLEQMGIEYRIKNDSDTKQTGNLSFIDQSHTLHIPLISPNFKVCAGDGNCYEDMPLEFEGTYELNSPEISALFSEDGLIAMRVEGDSMIGKRIYDGDTVIFDRSHDYTTGNICLVCLDGRFMIKGLISQGAGKPPILRSANPEYRDIVVSEDSQFAVLGRLITVDPKNFNPGSII